MQFPRFTGVSVTSLLIGVASNSYQVTWNRECMWDYIKQGDYSPLSPINFHKSAKASCVPERKGAGGLWEQWKGIHKSVREHLAKPDIS